MNPRPELAGRQPQPRQPEAGRIGYKAFSWWTMMNVVTREPIRTPNARRGWRAVWQHAKG
jgi:hypothetical protein